jgi:hypothetical protein
MTKIQNHKCLEFGAYNLGFKWIYFGKRKFFKPIRVFQMS